MEEEVAPKQSGAPVTTTDRASSAWQPSSTSNERGAGNSPKTELPAFTTEPKTPPSPGADCSAQFPDVRNGITDSKDE